MKLNEANRNANQLLKDFGDLVAMIKSDAKYIADALEDMVENNPKRAALFDKQIWLVSKNLSKLI
jgi:hypothetical protein